MKYLLLTVILTLAPVMAHSTTYYVFQQNGNDYNPGTLDRPWRTIQKAADTVVPGDKVIVQAGTYYERVVMKNSGTEGSPIVFEGERGSEGAWKSVIDGGSPVTGWVSAPEVGPGVWKTTKIPYEPYAITVDGKTVWRINPSAMNGETILNSQGTGFSHLALPAKSLVYRAHVSDYVSYWDGIEALFGYRNKTTYIRFRHGDDPNTRHIRSAPNGGTITIDNKSHIVIRNFKIGSGRNAVAIRGKYANNNIFENNYLSNGNVRVLINNEASRNIIRNNEITMDAIGTVNFQPGEWNKSSYTRKVMHNIYMENKFIVGRTREDDNGIQISGLARDNEISGNHIFNGVVGIELRESIGTKIYKNVIHNMSAQGIWPNEFQSAEIDDNLFFDNDHHIRIQQLENSKTLYIYRNRFHEPSSGGKHIHFSFGVKTAISPATIWIYHNSFAGGGWAADLGGTTEGDKRLPNVHMVNNVFSTDGISSGPLSDRVGQFAYNWLGSSTGMPLNGFKNITEWGKRIWAGDTVPDFILPKDSKARNAGIDLSRSFTINGKTYNALPGMSPAYYTDGRPDLGATQGMSQTVVPPPTGLRKVGN